jgi:hypothetical protein
VLPTNYHFSTLLLVYMSKRLVDEVSFPGNGHPIIPTSSECRFSTWEELDCHLGSSKRACKGDSMPQAGINFPVNSFAKLTQNGIDKVIKNALPVTLQVFGTLGISGCHVSDKVSFVEPGCPVASFVSLNVSNVSEFISRRKIILPDGKMFVEVGSTDYEAIPVRPMLHLSDGNFYIQALIRKHPLAMKCVLAGLKPRSIITVTKAATSWFRGNIAVLEIYDFNVLHDDCPIVGSPCPYKETSFLTRNEGTLLVNWTKRPTTYSGCPGLRLPCGKWILEEDDNSSDDIDVLIRLHAQVAQYKMHRQMLTEAEDGADDVNMLMQVRRAVADFARRA